MRFEPFFASFVIRAEGLDKLPEFFRVVHMFKVGEFVKNDIVADFERRLDKAPVEGNRGFL